MTRLSSFHSLHPSLIGSPLPVFTSAFTRITVDPPPNRHFFSRSSVPSSVVSDGTACNLTRFTPDVGFQAPAKVEVKTEELDTVVRVTSEENPAPAEREGAPDQERIEISSDEGERMEVDDALGSGSQDTSGGDGERTVSTVGGFFHCRRSGC